MGLRDRGNVKTLSGRDVSYFAQAGFSGCLVTGTIATTSGGTTRGTFASEEYDTDSYHDLVSNTGRLTAPTTGYYLIFAHGYQDAIVAASLDIFLQKNAASNHGQARILIQLGNTPWTIVAQLALTAGDDLELVAVNNTTTASQTTTVLGFGMTRLTNLAGT